MAYGTGGRVDKHEQKEKGKQTETKKSPEKREQTGEKGKARAREQTEVQEINHEDLALKTAAQYFGEELLPLLGITAEVRYAAPTENVRLEARQMYQDFNYITSGGTWIHLEFESDSITREDLRRFREYEAATSRTFQVAVITYVICSSNVRKLMNRLAEGINVYQVNIIRLKDKNADSLISGLEKKQKQGEPLRKEDLVPLLLTPLMSGRLNIGDRIIRSIELLQGSRASVTETELEKMYAVLYTLADKFLGVEDLSKVKERIAMTKLGTMLFNDGIERGKVEGKAEGKAEIVAIIRKKAEKGLDVQKIAEVMELDPVYVKRITDLLTEAPARTDLQVAEILIGQE